MCRLRRVVVDRVRIEDASLPFVGVYQAAWSINNPRCVFSRGDHLKREKIPEMNQQRVEFKSQGVLI